MSASRKNSEQDTAEFVILPGLREQARRGGIRRLTALGSDRRKIEETYLKAVDIGYSYRLAKKMEEFKSNPVLGLPHSGIEGRNLIPGIPEGGDGADRAL